MAKIAIITGIAGQDGAYMSRLLLSSGYSVIGVGRSLTEEKLWRLRELSIVEEIELITGDIIDAGFVFNLLHKYKPDELYNFAAISFVGQSWVLPASVMQINCGGVLNVLEAIKEFSPQTKLYQAGSSEMFGRPRANLQDEGTGFSPCNPYGVSKASSFHLTKIYREAYSLFCCNAICYNHESELRGIEYVTRKITNGVARIKFGMTKELRLGNIDAVRDWGNAEDFVRGMWLMLQAEKPDDYILSTGESHSIKEFLNTSFSAAGIDEWQRYVVEDKNFFRPLEPYILCGNHDKASNLLGWNPKIVFKETVCRMVEADIQRLQKQGT